MDGLERVTKEVLETPMLEAYTPGVASARAVGLLLQYSIRPVGIVLVDRSYAEKDVPDVLQDQYTCWIRADPTGKSVFLVEHH